MLAVCRLRKLSMFTQALHRISTIIFSVYTHTPNFHSQFHLNQHPPSMFYMEWIFILLCTHLRSRCQRIAIVYLLFVRLSFRGNNCFTGKETQNPPPPPPPPPSKKKKNTKLLIQFAPTTFVYGEALKCDCNLAYVDSGSLTAL